MLELMYMVMSLALFVVLRKKSFFSRLLISITLYMVLTGIQFVVLQIITQHAPK